MVIWREDGAGAALGSPSDPHPVVRIEERPFGPREIAHELDPQPYASPQCRLDVTDHSNEDAVLEGTSERTGRLHFQGQLMPEEIAAGRSVNFDTCAEDREIQDVTVVPLGLQIGSEPAPRRSDRLLPRDSSASFGNREPLTPDAASRNAVADPGRSSQTANDRP